MTANERLHDRIRAALGAAPNGLTVRELTLAVRGQADRHDNAISTALRRMRIDTEDIVSVIEHGTRWRYFLAGTAPTNLDAMHLLTVPWAGHVGPLLDEAIPPTDGG
jgi:hypothetical protein